MKYLKIIILLATLSLMASCSKNTPADTFGEVQFFFKGSIGTDVVNYEAGVENYVMDTYFEDAGATDVLQMVGLFKNKTDSTADYLSFQFYGYDSLNNEFIQTNVFNERDVFSYSADSTQVTSGVLELKFDAMNLLGSTHTWDFGDGSPLATAATVNHIYNTNNPVNVSLVSSSQLTQCTDSITNTIDLANLQSCQVQFDVAALSANLDSFQYIATGGFNTYNWLVNGVNLQINNSVIDQMYNDSIRREIQLIATKQGGTCTSTWNAIITPSLTNGCFAGFKYSILQQPTIINSIRPSSKTCIITYRKNGVIYRSVKPDFSDQSNRIVFSITGSSAYENNAAGQKTIRLNGSVNTFLYNVNNVNDSIPIVSSQVSIAVAHP
jgi:hypothetical protein